MFMCCMEKKLLTMGWLYYDFSVLKVSNECYLISMALSAESLQPPMYRFPMPPLTRSLNS